MPQDVVIHCVDTKGDRIKLEGAGFYGTVLRVHDIVLPAYVVKMDGSQTSHVELEDDLKPIGGPRIGRRRKA